MEKTIQGSLGAVSAFQLTEDMDALDKQSKKILQYREVLAIILKETVEEYQGYFNRIKKDSERNCPDT